MEENIRSVLVKISAEYLVLKYSYGILCSLKTDLDRFSIEKMAL